MVPYELDILIHYYAHVDDHPDLMRKPPIWQPTMDAFVELGLLKYHAAMNEDVAYTMLPRGKAFVDALQRVPLPVQVWVIPEVEAQR